MGLDGGESEGYSLGFSPLGWPKLVGSAIPTITASVLLLF